MPQARKTYLLDPKKLSPETIAVTFAKTSRSPFSFQEIADELTDEKSADFHEKWVVGYGHSSVAEHAVLHIAVENISRLAVECLESNRLASYTEKSSRYQIWDEDHFYIPQELKGSAYEADYLEIHKMLFSHYRRAFESVSTYLHATCPKAEKESQNLYEQRIRTRCADVCRYYLPASALANVGMTINARALEHALVKMLSHSLTEVREVGREIKQVARDNVPTLVKYAHENEYLKNLRQIYSQPGSLPQPDPGLQEDWFRFFECGGQSQEDILAALMYCYGHSSFEQCQKHIQNLNEDEKKKIATDLLGRLKEYDTPIRELEYAVIRLDVILDQGAYFELKRHRMMTQSAQLLTTHLGFALPSLLTQAQIEKQFVEDMHRVMQVYQKIADFNPEVAAYLVPNAFNRRILMQMNLRSALHLIKLRSAPNAHFAIRRLALRLADELSARYPLFSDWLAPTSGETWQSVSADFFHQLS